VGSIQLSHVSWRRPGGAALLDDVSFHVGDGDHVGLVGVNGVGKTTLLRLISGDAGGATGTITIDGRVGFMRQLVGQLRDSTVAALLLSVAPPRLQRAADVLHRAERDMHENPDNAAKAMHYATALGEWGEVGGYDFEVFWDTCTTKAIGRPYAEVASRPVGTLSGGEQKRLALHALLYGEHDVLLLDEPDNFLDIPGKRWLEAELQKCAKTILFVSHDREVLAAAATKIVTIEAHGAWTHGGSFATYHDARQERMARLEQDANLFDRERERLEELVKEMRRRAKISDTFAPRLKAAESRLRQFNEKNKAPVRVQEQRIDVRLRGARTGKKALTIEALELAGLTDPFDAEIWFGDRVAVLGPNGAGKSHFLRAIAGDPGVEYAGRIVLGANVKPGSFSQTHHHPELSKRTLLEILEGRDVVRGPAMAMLRRYELHGCAEQWFDTLSGGQQARFQVVLLELTGATLLLLDEPTDNLDLESAEALEAGLAGFEGTIVAVTHDRWFLRGFDRFLVFDDDCAVTDHLEPPAAYR
jgi:ATPase subunit of ABC transporter with duplicated ATPase domains